MADKKISELVSLTGANAATGDLLPIVDISATETKKITRGEFFKGIPSNVGIGTSSPDAKFMVSEGVNDTASALFYNTAGGSGSVQGKGYIGFGISESWNFHGAEIGWDQEATSGFRQALTFSTRGNSDVRPIERMRITSSGVVEIAEGSVVLNGSTISAVQVTIADDAVAELTFTNRRFGMLSIVEGSNDDTFSGFQEMFLGYADFGDSAFGTTAIAGSETVLDTTNTLTGTTGTDGKFTIGLAGTSGTLYLENRRGGPRTYNVTLL